MSTLTNDTRDHISFPVHCTNCKRPTSIGGRVGAKISICKTDKCIKDKGHRRVLLDDTTVEISNGIIFI